MASIEHDLFIEEWQATPTKVMLVLKDYNYSSQADRHRPLDRFNLKDREAGVPYKDKNLLLQHFNKSME